MEELPDDGGWLFDPPRERSGPDEDRPPPSTDDTGAAPSPSVAEAAPEARPEPADPPLFPSAEGGPAGSLFAPPHAAPRRASPAAAAATEVGRNARSLHVDGGAHLPVGGSAAGMPPAGPAQHGGPPPGPPPPPMGPPSGPGGGATAPAPSRRTPGDRLVGQVDGTVTVAVDSRGLRGARVLVVAAVLAALLRTVGWILSDRAELPQFVDDLLVGVLVVAALAGLIDWGFGVPLVALWRAFADGAEDGSTWTRLRALRIDEAGWPRTSVAVVRFRLRGMTGELISCVLTGAADGREIRSGDHLLVEGRRQRSGEVVVRRMELLEGPTGPLVKVVESRPTSRSVGVVVVDWLGRAVGVALLAWVVIDLLGR